MSRAHSTQSTADHRVTLGAAVAAAIAASLCCVGPLVLIGLGASGAWMSGLSALEPIKPLLTLATGGFLGYAFARVYGKSSQSQVCEPGSLCADPRTDRINKVALWGVTIVVAGLLMVPSIVGWVDASNNQRAKTAAVHDGAAASAAVSQGRERVVLSVQNMTCEACPHNVRKALASLDGVEVIEVTSDPPRAIVEYDSAMVSVDELSKATNDIGYPSSPLEL